MIGDDVGEGEVLGLFVIVGASVGDALTVGNTLTEPPPLQAQHMAFEEKSPSSYEPHQSGQIS